MNPVKISIIINNKEVPLFKCPKTFSDMYMEGREGSEYTIRLKNTTTKKVLVIPSVDGLSVLDGKPADISSSSGFVLSPFQTMDIPGWMVTDKVAAKFKFGKSNESYVAQTSQNENNLGVIGLAVYAEKYIPRYRYHDDYQLYYGTGSPTSSALRGIQISASSAQNSSYQDEPLGTVFGESTDFKTSTTSFEKGDLLSVTEIFYVSYQELVERGFIVPQKAVKPKPSAFSYGCTPPANWKG
jgi:hypothetical protein